MKPHTATFLGFLAASILPAAFQAIVFPLSGYYDLWSIVGTFAVAYYFSALAITVLGVPAFLLLTTFRLVTWWSAAGLGAFAGVLVLCVITSGFELLAAFRFALLGGATGLVFWSVWRCGRTSHVSKLARTE